MTGKGACDGTKPFLGKGESESVERYHTAPEKPRKCALPYQVHLKPSRKTTSYRELARYALSHAPTTTLKRLNINNALRLLH